MVGTGISQPENTGTCRYHTTKKQWKVSHNQNKVVHVGISKPEHSGYILNQKTSRYLTTRIHWYASHIQKSGQVHKILGTIGREWHVSDKK